MRKFFGGILVGTALLSTAALAASPAAAPDLGLDIYAQPGQLVDIGGGRHMNLRCSGSSAPTVLLDIGTGMTSMSWRKVQPLVAKTNRVCSYDRAGYAFSDPAAPPRTAQAEAEDLGALVTAAQLPTPLILVGHSMASYIVRLYAAAHPKDVAGIVLVDPISESLADDAPAVAQNEAKLIAENDAHVRKCAEAAHKGELDTPGPAAQACVPPSFPGLSERLSDSVRQRFRSAVFWDTSLSERESGAANNAAMKAAPALVSNPPLIVLAADGTNSWLPADQRKAADAAYDAGRKRIARQSSHGVVVRVKDSSHDMQEDRPDAIAQAIARMTAAQGKAAAK
jgi:pimeloyl-ACP methyl ester carboxylesterase